MAASQHRLLLIVAVFLGLTGAAGPARADTFLFLDSEPEDGVGGGVVRLVSSPEGAFAATSFYNPAAGPGFTDDIGGVHIQVSLPTTTPAAPYEYWSLAFSVPFGPLRPGTFGQATSEIPIPAGKARMVVESFSASCRNSEAKFVVHEVVTDGVELLSFAADFEQRCDEGRGPLLQGAIRYRAGSAACGAGSDGRACDDRNPCTREDTCGAGVCAGTAPAGRCSPVTCDDGNACTQDVVEATGCLRVPAMSCWDVETRGTLVVEALGKRCSCRLPRGRAVIGVNGDRTFRMPGGRLPGGVDGCPSGRPVRIPDEVGTWDVAGRQGMKLKTTNLDELIDASERCAGQSTFNVKGYRTRLKTLRGATVLRGTNRLTGRTSGVPVTVITRFKGVPGTGEIDGAPSLAGVGTSARRCAARINACLRD